LVLLVILYPTAAEQKVVRNLLVAKSQLTRFDSPQVGDGHLLPTHSHGLDQAIFATQAS